MTMCKDCKHFRAYRGIRRAIKGSCKLKNTASYTDLRYGRNKACKLYERSDSE